ncbi:MAG: T9SS type A sorting domain-containing protein [Bacteroidia bacterium]|nr:T9SS type A sorting domain-containing protein [Bacteroidia bacterium]
MKRRSITIFAGLFFLLSNFLSAQQAAILDSNDVSIRINPAGTISWDLVGFPGCEIPKGSGSHCLFAGELWMGAIDDGGSLRVSAQTYRQSGVDFDAGPIAKTYSTAYDSIYNRVWEVSMTEIIQHQNLVGSPNYVVPEAIENWPAFGDTLNGMTYELAPFFDVDNNGLYEPAKGDYPSIKGDKAVFFMFNDLRNPNTETLGMSLGAEIKGLVYQFDQATGDPLDQTVFFSYSISNKSNSPWNDYYASLWLDVDLGSFNDDMVGTDSLRNTVFAYNGDNDDAGTGGYGINPPAIGLSYLNQDLAYSIKYVNNFSPSGNPQSPQDYYNYLRGRWKDSTSLTFGGNGYGGNIPTRYIFPGNVTDSSQWSEISSGNFPADTRVMGSVGPFTILPGESLCMDMALVFARGDTTDHLENVLLLGDRIDEVINFFGEQSSLCNFPIGNVSNEEIVGENWAIGPNPVGQELGIHYTGEAMKPTILRVFAANGSLIDRVLLTKNSTQLNWSDYSPGIYYLMIQQGSQSFYKKLLKE